MLNAENPLANLAHAVPLLANASCMGMILGLIVHLLRCETLPVGCTMV